MKLDIQEIHHNYITRMVIFAIFLFSKFRNTPRVYEESVRSYIRRKIKFDIQISIDTGVKMDRDEERDLVLDQVLENRDVDYLNLIVVNFKTGHKEISLQIDLSQESKYESYIYA